MKIKPYTPSELMLDGVFLNQSPPPNMLVIEKSDLPEDGEGVQPLAASAFVKGCNHGCEFNLGGQLMIVYTIIDPTIEEGARFDVQISGPTTLRRHIYEVVTRMTRAKTRS
ncbi:MAG: hypothetical protein ABIA47_01240 [bacterium]